MSTYYIRVFRCEYNGAFNSDVYSPEGLLHSNANGDATDVEVLRLQENAKDRYYHISGSGKRLPPTKTSPIYVSEDVTITWDDRYLESIGFEASVWVTKGWSNPTSSQDTFLQELCDFFEDAKNAAYGDDNGNVNLYLFEYKYTNQPSSGYAYYPIFFKGNDPNYQTTKVAT